MIPKPRHLSVEYATQFQDASVVQAYENRSPYPAQTFDILAGLITDVPRTVLDIGCGRGEIARPLAPRVDGLDAVDPSKAMIETGKTLPGGDHPNLRWIVGRAEEAPLNPPYALITAGSSLHWLEWDVVMPRFADMLTPGGYLALVYPESEPLPWDDELKRIIPLYSTNRDFEPYDLLEELEKRGLFDKVGERLTAPVSFAQPLPSYIEAFHSMNGFSRQRMTPLAAAEFDTEVKRLVSPHLKDGLVEQQIVVRIIWGKPRKPI